MRLKESLFWFFILFLFFGGGYLHGSLPFYKIKKLMNPDKHLRILVYSPHFFPDELTQKLEKKSYSVRIDPVQHFDDLKIEVLKSPGPDLILIPASWIAQLTKENLLQTLPLENFSELAPDFGHHEGQFVPWFWFVTKSFTFANKPEKTPVFKKGPTAQNVLIPGDNSVWLETLLDKNFQEELQAGGKLFLPHNIKIEGAISQFEAPSSELWILGWSIPQSAESLSDSIRLLKDLYSHPLYETTLLAVPGSSTLERTNKEPWDHWKKPESLRDLPLKEIKF